MSQVKTEIEKWIEKEGLNYNEPNSTNKYVLGMYRMLTYLGLSDIHDPKNHIRHLEFRANEGLEVSKEFEDFKENAERLSLKYTFKIELQEEQIAQLKAENTELKEGIQKLTTQINELHSMVKSRYDLIKGE